MTADSFQYGSGRWEYGKLRASHSWVLWVSLGVGVLALPVAWLVRDLVEVGGNPLPAWTVLLVGAILAVVFLLLTYTLYRARSRPAKLITINDGKINVPGGLMLGRGWSLPIGEVQVRTFDLGFVRQLQLSGGRRRTTLSSALFESDDEFDRLNEALQHRQE